MRRLAGLLCLGFTVSPVWAARGAIRTETVQLRSGGQTVSGFLAMPSSPGRHPGLVVIHEWWGLVPWVKEQAERFARQGYVALAPDLYHGKAATDPAIAHELMRGMPEDRAVRDLKAAFDYLAARSDVEPDKIGSVGWCMGGGLSIQLAVHEPRLAACVLNYGALPTDPAAIAQIASPVLGNFGGLDHGITPDDVQAFEGAMKAAGKNFDAKIYPDAGHAFENPNNKAGYRAEDAADAWARMSTFLGKALR